MHGISRASWLSCILAVFGFGKLVRADPVEARKDFVGYHAEGDGTCKSRALNVWEMALEASGD